LDGSNKEEIVSLNIFGFGSLHYSPHVASGNLSEEKNSYSKLERIKLDC
jgi:hypothetical protein